MRPEAADTACLEAVVSEEPSSNGYMTVTAYLCANHNDKIRATSDGQRVSHLRHLVTRLRRRGIIAKQAAQFQHTRFYFRNDDAATQVGIDEFMQRYANGQNPFPRQRREKRVHAEPGENGHYTRTDILRRSGFTRKTLEYFASRPRYNRHLGQPVSFARNGRKQKGYPAENVTAFLNQIRSDKIQ